MKRDAALFLLGAWMLGILAMALVAMENFYTIDRLLESASHARFKAAVEALDNTEGAPARDVLRYVSSELNRLFFMAWGVGEAAIGAVLVWLVWGLPDRRVRGALIGAWVLTLILTFAITPPIISVGRALDFVPRDPPPPELATFGMLHAAYSIADIVKLGLGLFAAWGISRSGKQL
jgi:hypothetical protein